jgi:hypothetical protein
VGLLIASAVVLIVFPVIAAWLILRAAIILVKVMLAPVALLLRR